MPQLSDITMLPASLDLAAAQPLQRLLLDHDERERTLSLDGRAVERVSTACLQLLLAAARAARARGLDFALHDPSPVLRAACSDLGLAHELLG